MLKPLWQCSLSVTARRHKTAPLLIPLRPSDTSPEIVEELPVGLPTEGRKCCVRLLLQGLYSLLFNHTDVFLNLLALAVKTQTSLVFARLLAALSLCSLLFALSSLLFNHTDVCLNLLTLAVKTQTSLVFARLLAALTSSNQLSLAVKTQTSLVFARLFAALSLCSFLFALCSLITLRVLEPACARHSKNKFLLFALCSLLFALCSLLFNHTGVCLNLLTLGIVKINFCSLLFAL